MMSHEWRSLEFIYFARRDICSLCSTIATIEGGLSPEGGVWLVLQSVDLAAIGLIHYEVEQHNTVEQWAHWMHTNLHCTHHVRTGCFLNLTTWMTRY